MDDCLVQCLTLVCAAITAFAVIYNGAKTKLRYRRLKRDYFVGARWQKDLFDNIVNKSLTEDMLFSIINRYDPTENWIEKDLSEYYSSYMIFRFYINRRDMIEEYYLKREWRVTFEGDLLKK